MNEQRLKQALDSLIIMSDKYEKDEPIKIELLDIIAKELSQNLTYWVDKVYIYLRHIHIKRTKVFYVFDEFFDRVIDYLNDNTDEYELEPLFTFVCCLGLVSNNTYNNTKTKDFVEKIVKRSYKERAFYDLLRNFVEDAWFSDFIDYLEESISGNISYYNIVDAIDNKVNILGSGGITLRQTYYQLENIYYGRCNANLDAFKYPTSNITPTFKHPTSNITPDEREIRDFIFHLDLIDVDFEDKTLYSLSDTDIKFSELVQYIITKIIHYNTNSPLSSLLVELLVRFVNFSYKNNRGTINFIQSVNDPERVTDCVNLTSYGVCRIIKSIDEELWLNSIKYLDNDTYAYLYKNFLYFIQDYNKQAEPIIKGLNIITKEYNRRFNKEGI